MAVIYCWLFNCWDVIFLIFWTQKWCVFTIKAAIKTLCFYFVILLAALTSFWFSTYTAIAMYLFLKALPSHVLRAIRKKRKKKGRHFPPTWEQIAFSLSARRKQSDRKLPWKIACSEWLSSKRGPRPGRTYAPASEWASTWMGKWPTEWMALWLMVTR